MSSTGIISLLISTFKFFRFSEGSEEEGLGVVVIEGGLCLTDSPALGTGYFPSEFLGELANYGSDRVGKGLCFEAVISLLLLAISRFVTQFNLRAFSL